MAQNGRKMRLKVSDGSSSYITIAGCQEDSMTLENGEIDITTKDSDAKRELLGGGTQTVAVSTNGVYYGSDDGAKNLFQQAMSGAIQSMQLEFEDGETFEGNFQVGSYERTGAHDGAVTFTCDLKSSGDYTYTAPTE